MKNFLPVIFFAIVFTAMVVSQMSINGQELAASKIQQNQDKFLFFESAFSKLKIKTTQGTQIELAKSKKPIVIVNFWASWCQPCVREFQSLNQMLDKYEDRVLVVGVNSDTENAIKEIKKVEAKYNLKFESTTDSKNELAARLNITKIPSTIIFHEGKVIRFSEKEFDFMAEDFQTQLKEIRL